MNITLTPSNLSDPSAKVSGTPETIVSEAQVAVGVGLVVLLAPPPAGTSYSMIMINRSPAAQVIRIGNVPSFAPAAGLSLNVGETLTLNNVGSGIQAISSLAGGLLDIIIFTP